MDKVICFGKNYLDHAKELGDAVPQMPVLFLKPPSSCVFAPAPEQRINVSLPRSRGSVHHECEIVLKLSQNGRIEAVTLGVDLTLRDLQSTLKANGHPWEISKAFSSSAIIGPWISMERFADYLDQEFTFSVDGLIRQKGLGREMRLCPEDCIAYAAEQFKICAGDLVFTGTPVGVGPLHAGETSELRWQKKLLYTVCWV